MTPREELEAAVQVVSTADRFITPGPVPTPHQREILTIMTEEAAEVILELGPAIMAAAAKIQQRAAKASRFGLGEVQPGHDATNAQRLAAEIGDLLGIVDRAVERGIIARADIEAARLAKGSRLDKYMQTEPDIRESKP